MNSNEKNNGFIDTVSLVATAGSIFYSIWLFQKGQREQAIFVGLWPPTFMAMGTLLKQTFGKATS